jgi:hypothetical protein
MRLFRLQINRRNFNPSSFFHHRWARTSLPTFVSSSLNWKMSSVSSEWRS